MVNKERLLKLTRRLISIDSQNPPGDESAIASFVKEYLSRLGLTPKIYEFKKKRANLIAVLKGKGRTSLLITPHLDTVPCGKNWRFDPFTATLRKNKLYGLGATDCKGNLACGMEVLSSLVEEGAHLQYDLIFAATADEESGSVWGLEFLLDKKILKPDEAVVLDADDFEIIVAQKGLMHLKVRIEGRRAHGAYPWLGVNAVNLAVDILKELKEKKPAAPKNKYLHPPTVNIGTIRGGDKVNVVADWCEFELDFRFLPGESDKKILKELKKIIRKHASRFSIEIEGIQQPFGISEAHSLVRSFSGALREEGIVPRISGSEGATTISFFQEKNIPAIATGFGCEGCAHTADEYADINKLYKGSRALERFLLNYKF
jgi:succinyl-diaminopimelate desuccinylase